jgi:hypothetical protein
MFRFLLLSVFAMFLSVAAPGAYSGTITATADAGGIITPSGTITVARGGSKTFAISSSNPAQYVLVDVVVNGRSKGPISGYTFNKVGRLAQLSIHAKFKSLESLPPPTCANGATNYPTCTPPTCANGATNYPTCTPPTCANGATNYPTCTPPTCANGATDYPTCTPPTCANGATNYPTCTPPTCANGATNYPTCTPPTCANGATDYPTCTPPTCANGATNYPTCTPPTCANGATNYPTCTPPTCANGATNYPTCTPPPSEPIAVNLIWSVPTKMTNGDPLLPADIVGYEVYYTSMDGTISDIVAITSSTTTSAVVMVPTAGTYYFSIGTIATQGVKSEMTNPIEVVVK